MTVVNPIGALGDKPIGPAGGDLTGTYPNPTLNNKGAANGPALLDASGSVLSAKGGEANSALGTESAASLSTGKQNTALGFQALKADTTGSANSAFGALTLRNNTAGSRNTALGFNALNANLEGSECVAVGANALASNTEGAKNNALGFNALANTTTGSSNTAVGYQALRLATTQEKNVAVGGGNLEKVSGAGNFNTAIGWNALHNDTTGERNTALGMEAMNQNITGTQNVALGYAALAENSEGNGNTGVGVLALGFNSAGTNEGKSEQNTALGFHAGELNSAKGNVFLGYRSGSKEAGSNTLYIANSETEEPLLKGDFAGKTLRVFGTLSATSWRILAADPTALAEKAAETATEPSPIKPTMVTIIAETAALTRSKINILVKGVLVAQLETSAVATGVSIMTATILVPPATNWEWKKIEGTVNKVSFSNTVIG